VLFPAVQPVPQAVWALAALAELQREAQGVRDDSPWSVLDGWRLNSTTQRTLTLRFGDEVQPIGVAYVSGGHELTIGGQSLVVRGQFGPSGTVHAQLGERRVSAAVVTSGEKRQVFFEGRSWPVTVVGALSAGGGGDDHAGGLKAPMPGKVIALIATAGSVVEKGTPLLVLEAMKMEHTISAPAKGLVKAFHFAAGDQVTDGVELVDFEVEVQP